MFVYWEIITTQIKNTNTKVILMQRMTELYQAQSKDKKKEFSEVRKVISERISCFVRFKFVCQFVQ